MKNTVTVVEATPIQETWCDGMLPIQPKGPCIQLTFYSEDRPFGDEHIERRVVAKIIGSVAALQEVANQIQVHLASLRIPGVH